MILKLLTFSFLLISLFSFGQWEQRASPPFTKDHGIGFSIGGYGYVLTGGSNGQPFSATKDFFKYDPNTDTWSQLPDYPGPIRGYGIGDVWDGKLYFGFGDNQAVYLNDLWSWDPVTDIFTQLPSCPCVGRDHPALLATNGKVYVGAGGSASGNLNDWWEYDIATQVWDQKANIPGARHHPYQFVINGEIYVGNGHLSTWYKYDAMNDSWSSVATLTARVAGAQFSYNGKGYALSGTDVNHNRFATGEFWEYDPIANNWTALPPHSGFSRFAPAQFLIDDYIYILGGYNRINSSLTPVTTMERYGLNGVAGTDKTVSNKVVGSIYPNPADNEIVITLNKELTDKAIVNIYSLSGQLTLNTKYQPNIDISSLEVGLYIIDVVDETGSIFRQKISKI